MIGATIRKMRKARGFTQHELANMTGIAQSTISGYETFFSRPNYGELIKILDACEYEMVFLDKKGGGARHDDPALQSRTLRLV